MKSLVFILCLGLVAAVAIAFPQPQSEDAPPSENNSPGLMNGTVAGDTVEDNDDTVEDKDNTVEDNDDTVEDNDNTVEDKDDDDDDDDDDSPESRPKSIESNSNETQTLDDAVSEIPEEVLDIDALKSLVYEFTNLTTGLNTDQLLSRLSSLEENIRKTSTKLNKDLEKERQKLAQLNSLLSQISELRGKLTDFDSRLNSLTSGIGNLGKEGLPNSPFPSPFEASGGNRHRSWATLYRSRGHSGRSYELDFRTCSIYEECCKNLSDLDNDSQSIHTHDTCVKLYKDRDCTGDGQEYYPGSGNNHGDFGSNNDSYSSGKPCTRG